MPETRLYQMTDAEIAAELAPLTVQRTAEDAWLDHPARAGHIGTWSDADRAHWNGTKLQRDRDNARWHVLHAEQEWRVYITAHHLTKWGQPLEG